MTDFSKNTSRLDKAKLALSLDESFALVAAVFDPECSAFRRMKGHFDAILFTLKHEASEADLAHRSA